MKKLVLIFVLSGVMAAVYAATPTTRIALKADPISVRDSVDLSQYAGKYKMTGLPFESITIAVKDGQLTIDTGSESGAMTAVKDSPDTFDAAGRAILKFKRDDAKKVNGVTLEAQSMKFEGMKEL